jgi:hypothetical protein
VFIAELLYSRQENIFHTLTHFLFPSFQRRFSSDLHCFTLRLGLNTAQIFITHRSINVHKGSKGLPNIKPVCWRACNKNLLHLCNLRLFAIARYCRICFCSYIKVITYLMLHKALHTVLVPPLALLLREAHILNTATTEIGLILLFPSLSRKQ